MSPFPHAQLLGLNSARPVSRCKLRPPMTACTFLTTAQRRFNSPDYCTCICEALSLSLTQNFAPSSLIVCTPFSNKLRTRYLHRPCTARRIAHHIPLFDLSAHHFFNHSTPDVQRSLHCIIACLYFGVRPFSFSWGVCPPNANHILRTWPPIPSSLLVQQYRNASGRKLYHQ
jgi:hypothetical protein